MGMRFGRLKVQQLDRVIGHPLRAVCQCDCGKLVIVFWRNLKTGNTRSCGCWRTKRAPARGTVAEFCAKHRISRSTYYNWRRRAEAVP